MQDYDLMVLEIYLFIDFRDGVGSNDNPIRLFSRREVFACHSAHDSHWGIELQRQIAIRYGDNVFAGAIFVQLFYDTFDWPIIVMCYLLDVIKKVQVLYVATRTGFAIPVIHKKNSCEQNCDYYNCLFKVRLYD